MFAPRVVRFRPGVVGGAGTVTLPAVHPGISRIASGIIIRQTGGVAITAHPQADVVASLAAHAAAAVVGALAAHPAADVVGALLGHAVHSHPLALSAGGAGATIIAGAALLSASSGAQVIGAGGPAGDGVRDNAAAQDHAAGAGTLGHGAGAGTLAHAVGGATVAHTVTTSGATVEVATVLALSTTNDHQFTTTVAILISDEFDLIYYALGEFPTGA